MVHEFVPCLCTRFFINVHVLFVILEEVMLELFKFWINIPYITIFLCALYFSEFSE